LGRLHGLTGVAPEVCYRAAKSRDEAAANIAKLPDFLGRKD